MCHKLRLVYLALFSLALQAQAVGGVEIQRLDGDKSDKSDKSIVLPAPSPAFMDAVLSSLVGEAPLIGSASGSGDLASDVEWTVRGSLSPAFSEDTTFTFVAYMDGHRTLTVTRPMIVNAWYQMSGAPCLFEARPDPKTIASKLLSHSWSFSSKEHPELIALMDEVKALPGYKLFPKKTGKDSPQVMVVDGPSFTFDLTTQMGHLQLGGFPTFEANAPETSVFNWIDQCVTWIEGMLKATQSQDLKDSIARIDTACVGPVILCCASQQNLRDAVQQLLDAGVPVDSADPIEGRTPLMNAATNLDLEMTRSLLEHGAQVDRQDASGQTPLFLLLDRERYLNAVDFDAPTVSKMAELLLKAGASPDKPDRRDETPRSLAAKSRHADIRKLFTKSR